MPYKPNPAFPRKMEETPEFQAGLHMKAEAIKAQAEQLMPRGVHAGKHMADEFEVAEVNGELIVTNRHPFFFLAEYGSVHNPAYAPLRRAVQAAGFELRESPKP